MALFLYVMLYYNLHGQTFYSDNKNVYNVSNNLHYIYIISVCTAQNHTPMYFLLLKFHLFCGHPSSGDLMERKLEVHKNMILGEVTERAYQVSE